MTRTLPILLALLLAACSGSASLARQPAAGMPDLVYVCNQGEATVAVIDATTLEIVHVVDLKAMGYAANAKPHHVVVEADGAHWYLSLIGANRVLRFNSANEIVGTAAFDVPGMMVLHPDGERLFVGRSMSAVSPPQSIGEITVADMSVEEIDVFFPRPHALAVSPDGSTVYSASLAENRMIAIDLSTGDAAFTSLDGPIHTLVQFAVNPADGSLLVGGQLTGELFTLGAAGPDGAVTVRSSRTGEAQPWHPVFDADGRFAYIPNKGSNTVSVFDAAVDSVLAVIRDDAFAQPHGSALSGDGRHLFVSNQNTGAGEPGPGRTVVIDTASRQVVRVIEVGMMPSGVGSRGPARTRR